MPKLFETILSDQIILVLFRVLKVLMVFGSVQGSQGTDGVWFCSGLSRD